jgi:hypothetical protein
MPGVTTAAFGTKHLVIRNFIHRRLVRSRYYTDKLSNGQPINSLAVNARECVA